MKYNSVNQLVADLKNQGKQTDTESGRRWDVFHPAERYVVDFADQFKEEGWKQYDTAQDAPYFGVWVNPTTLHTLTYAEGDWTVREYNDIPSYNENIRQMNDFYEEGFIAKAIDNDGTETTYVQDRTEFFIKEAS